YDGQYLTVEAVNSDRRGEYASPRVDDLDVLNEHLSTFKERTTTKIDDWRRRIARWSSEGKRIVIWGSGSKGVSFLHAVAPGAAVACAVDINPYRQGYFMAGTAHEIVGPEKLTELKPDVVIVMNRIYVPEIAETLKGLNLEPESASL